MKVTPHAEITIEDPKAAIKDFTREGVDDLGASGFAMDRVGKRLPAMVDRANAWSVGTCRLARTAFGKTGGRVYVGNDGRRVRKEAWPGRHRDAD